MKNLAVNSEVSFQVPMSQERGIHDGNLDSLFDRLVMQLWTTYCEMGCTRLH